MKEDFSYYWRRYADEAVLNDTERQHAFELILSGQASALELAAFLVTLRERGETEDDLVTVATLLKRSCRAVSVPQGSIDSCGTGGDGRKSLNISTATAFVVAAAGVSVAKHGNRAQSSACGSADVLTALGVNVNLDGEALEAMAQRHRFVFLFAPAHHAAMRHVAQVRKALGVRTLFNLVGPLVNPAAVDYQLVGVFSDKWLMPMARSLARLGRKKVWVLHSRDGFDELSLNAPNDVVSFDGETFKRFSLVAEDYGLSACDPAELVGGDASYNAARLRALCDGEKDGFHDMVVFNAAAALFLVGVVSSLQSGCERAAELLATGKVKALLADIVDFSQKRGSS